MTITFTHGGKPYKGLVYEKTDNGRLLWYEVTFESGERFKIEQKTDGTWFSDFIDVSKSLVRTTGRMIDQVRLIKKITAGTLF